MKKYLYIICIWFGCATMASLSAQNGADLLDKAAATYEQSNGISASFALHVRGGVQDMAESFEGTIQMKGDKFTLITPDMQIWYDGKTQWVYQPRYEEVYVSEPSGQDLQMSNPMLLLRSYKNDFNARYIGQSTAANGRTAYDIELLPKKKGDIVRISLQVEKSSSFPARIVMEDKNKMVTTIQIDRLATQINQPDQFFAFDPENHPDVEVIRP